MTEIEVESPKVFISYSYDSKEHSEWVFNLASQLRTNSVDVIFDQFETKIGSDLALFMEQGLSQSHKVICICSEQYVIKANRGIAGVGYEKMIISAEYLKDANIDWVMPIIKNNISKEKTPTFLGTKKYIDFSDDSLYEKNYYNLLRDILMNDNYKKPPLGKNPFNYGNSVLNIIAGERLIKTASHIDYRENGIAKFKISSNNGEYYIGNNEFRFGTKWSYRGNESVFAYKDGLGINAIACAGSSPEIELAEDLMEFDFSNRTRAVNINDTIIWINNSGKIMLTKLIKVLYKDDNDIEISIEFKTLQIVWSE